MFNDYNENGELLGKDSMYFEKEFLEIEINNRKELKVYQNLRKAYEYMDLSQFQKALKYFKRVVRHRGTATKNIIIMKQDAYGKLAGVYSELNLYDKCFVCSEKCEKILNLLDGDYFLDKFITKLNRCLFLNEALEESDGNEEYLENLFLTLTDIFDDLKSRPRISLTDKQERLFYGVLDKSFFNFFHSGNKEKCLSLVDFIVNNSEFLKIDELSRENKEVLFLIMESMLDGLIDSGGHKELLRKYTIFIVDNFSTTDLEQYQINYKMKFSLLIGFLVTSEEENFEKYYSRFIDLYKNDNPNEVDKIIVLIMKMSVTRYLINKEYSSAFDRINEIEKYLKGFESSIEEVGMYDIVKMKAESLAGMGQFDEAEKLSNELEPLEDESHDDQLSTLVKFKDFAIKFKHNEKIFKYSKEILNFLENHRNVENWDFKYSLHTISHFAICITLNRENECMSMMPKVQKLIQKYKNTKNSELSTLVKIVEEFFDALE